MKAEGFLEREIEKICQLKLEESQLEEVEDHESSEEEDSDFNHRNSGGAPTSVEFTYDTSLAALHSYLGNIDDTHNRLTFLDGGAIFSLPIFYLEGVVLFPDATLPLRVIDDHLVAAIERAITQVEAPYTIGVVQAYLDPDNERVMYANIGSTAEIRKYRRLEDGSINILARGQQRFRLRRCWIDAEGATCGEIQVVEEDSPLRTPREAVGKLALLRTLQRQPLSCVRVNPCENEDEYQSDTIPEESFNGELSPHERRVRQSSLVSRYDEVHESTSSNDEKLECEAEVHRGRSQLGNLLGSLQTENDKSSEDAKKGIFYKQDFRRIQSKECAIGRLRDVSSAFWPSWVYQTYDSYWLAQKAADRWKQIVREPIMDCFVRKPDLLSFHIASKMPVSDSTRQELLEIDGISNRLRREIELLENFDHIRCKTCEALIAWRSDMLVMSNDGPLGAFVNLDGCVHEVMTFEKANGLAVIGHIVKEYSWFPGYTWSIAACSSCESQIGWLFTTTNKKKLKPNSFWGIKSSQVSVDTR